MHGNRVTLNAAKETLRKTFGFPDFRVGQAPIVDAILDGHDVLAVMPTGGGKSLCYQLPALLRDGLTVVVSPLIALMRNQVAQLQGFGIEAGALNSANSREETGAVFDAISKRTLRLLYIAPERLALADTKSMLQRAKVSLIAIDEAHCVSQWGHDFRPDYLNVGKIAEELPGLQNSGPYRDGGRRNALRHSRPPFFARAKGLRAWLRQTEFTPCDASEKRHAPSAS